MAALAAPALIEIFGKGANGKVPQIGDLVSNFDFKKISVSTEEKKDFLHCDLAPSFGKLAEGGLKDMDDDLKIMIAGTTVLISKINPEDRSWDKVMECCMQNPLLEPEKEAVARADKYIKETSDNFSTQDGPRETIVREVQSWFVTLINDQDVLDSTKIDIKVLGAIVASTGACVDSFESLFAKHEFHSKTMMDIGILRYPDYDHPYFKVYRIKLEAWRDSSRIFFHQEDKNGITGEFNSRIFKPRKSILDSMTQKARTKGIEKAESLFD